jgi:hypothetical protein
LVLEIDTGRSLMQEFISEDDLGVEDGSDIRPLTWRHSPSELEMWHDTFDEEESAVWLALVGLMKLIPLQGEYRYAVAVRETPIFG